MFRPVILTAKLAGCCSVRSMELTCSLSRQRFLRHGTNGFATCSRECHSATKPLHWLNGRRATELSDIWANGTPIRKTTPTRLASIDRNGTVCRPSVGISDQRSLSLLADMPCILSWCQAQAKDQYSPLWNSGTTNQCRPSAPSSSASRAGWCAGNIRRFGAGRESGFIYHRAKASLIPLAVLPWVTYLALPVSVNPLLILLPSAALLGVAMDIAAGSFKKYL